jgi:predicted nucleotidyltransferase
VQGNSLLTTASTARQAAARIARLLSNSPDIHGILLFGSVARGLSDDDSDIDILVVGTDPGLTSRRLLATLPAKLRERRPALQYYTLRGLSQLFDTGTAFTEHLRREGVILYDRDGSLRAIIKSPRRHAMSIEDEIAKYLARLPQLQNWPQYNGNFLACLAQLYIIGKSIVILALLRLDTPQFDHRTIFDSYRAYYPDRSAAIDTVAELAAFSRLLDGGKDDLPFSYRDAEDRARAAVGAIESLAAP